MLGALCCDGQGVARAGAWRGDGVVGCDGFVVWRGRGALGRVCKRKGKGCSEGEGVFVTG